MLKKPKPTKSGLVLLELCFNDICNEKLIIKMNKITAKTMIIFDFAQINYKNKNKTIVIKIEEIIDLLKILKSKLQLCLRGTMILHPSIKHPLGYYETKSYVKGIKKLVYKTMPDGNSQWVGDQHKLFEATPGIKIPFSWLYNDKEGNIILEISPMYPWHYNDPKSDETFVKYSEWIKNYKPYAITKIPKESAKQWVKDIDKLIAKVRRSDAKYRCTGLGCKHCIAEGKTGCPCGSKVKK